VIPAWLQDEFKDTLLYCFCCEARDTIQFIRMWQSTGDDALAFLRMAVVRAFIKTDPKLRPIPIAISCASVEDEMPRRATRSHCSSSELDCVIAATTIQSLGRQSARRDAVSGCKRLIAIPD
jgi:hypothetical protein